MKNIKFLFAIFLSLTIMSCSSDDDNNQTEETETFSIDFTLDGTEYSLTDYSVMVDPTNSSNRIVEASFDNNTKTIRFFMEIGEIGEMGEFIFINDGVNRISGPNLGNRDTSITVHTNSKMEGTFRVTIEDTFQQPEFLFTNGVINIEY